MGTATATATASPSRSEVDEDEDEDMTAEGEAEVVDLKADPGAVRRFRFRHPTASGKTIAAGGFVEAARTLGVLILTHRRLLVSQFTRDLTDEGYGDRLEPIVQRGARAKSKNPITIQTYAWFARHVDSVEPRRVPARDRRRGAHRPRREDQRGDPELPGAASTSA